MSDERIYFKVITDGFTGNVIKEFKEKHLSVKKSWFDFSKKYGGGENVFASDTIEGIKFENGEVFEGWKNTKNLPSDYFKPMKKIVCMDAYKDFVALDRLPNSFDFSSALGVSGFFSGRAIHHPSFESIGDTLLLSVHKDSEKIPEGVEPLKMSEYWTIKESVDAA